MDFVSKTVVCLMWYVAGNQADSDIQNPYYAYDYQDMTVLLQSTIKTSLQKATKLCKQNNGVLAHVSRGMYEKARFQFQAQVGRGRSYWVALNKPRESNVYTWPDGTPYNTSFYPNFPFFGPQNEQCAYVWKSSRGTYAYSATRCNGTAEVLCLIENPWKITTKSLTSTPRNRFYAYDYISITKRFNKEFYTDYKGATRQCRIYDGLLANIGLGMYQRAREQFLYITEENHYYWVDLRKRDGSNTYTWSDGTPYFQTKYSNFKFSGPRDKECVVVYRINKNNNVLASRSCDDENEVICMFQNSSKTITLHSGHVSTSKSSKENTAGGNTFSTKTTTPFSADTSTTENSIDHRRGHEDYPSNNNLLIVAVGCVILSLMFGLFVLRPRKKTKVVTTQEVDLYAISDYVNDYSGAILNPERKSKDPEENL